MAGGGWWPGWCWMDGGVAWWCSAQKSALTGNFKELHGNENVSQKIQKRLKF
jgi:hypothetical protein